MNFLRSFLFSLRKLTFPGSATAELEDEMRFHLEMSIEQKMAQGMDPVEAAREANKEFGSSLRMKEECRMNWGTRLVDETVQDLKRAARRLWKRPSYSVPVVVIFAVSLGFCGTFLDVLYQRILRPLNYPHVEEILEIGTSHPMEEYSDSIMNPTLVELSCIEEISDMFSSIGQLAGEGYFLKGEERTEFSYVAQMTAGMWEVMQQYPSYGRAFSKQDSEEGNWNLAVVTHSFATKRFGSAVNAIGEYLNLSGLSYKIVGVMGKGKRLPAYFDVTIPFNADAGGRYYAEKRDKRLRLLCRLKPEVTFSQLEARLPVVMERIKELNEEQRWFYEKFNIHLKFRPLVDSFRISYSKLSFDQLIWILSLLALLLFFLSCVNWLSAFRTNLIRDMRNTGICYALGATKVRMFFGIVIGNTMLLAVAGLLGIGVSVFLHAIINEWEFFEGIPILIHPFSNLSLVILCFAALIMSMPFVVYYLRTKQIQKYLQERQSTSSLRSKSLFALSLIQTFVGAVIVLISIFLTLNIRRILATDFGFEYENKIVAALNIPSWQEEWSVIKKLEVLNSIKEKISNLPGFENASVATTLPQCDMAYLTSSFSLDSEKFPFRTNDSNLLHDGRVSFRCPVVDVEFKETLGLQLLRGRWFQSGDAVTKELEIVIEHTTAMGLFGDENPVGFQFMSHRNGEVVDRYKIIGVVNDVTYEGRQQIVPLVGYRCYLFYAEPNQETSWFKDYMLIGDTYELGASHFQDFQKAVRELNSDLGFKMKSYTQAIRSKYGTMILMSKVSLAISVVTVLVAGYGFISFLFYKTQLQQKEFAIRLAMGARKSRMIRSYILKQSIPVFIGTLMGVGLVASLIGQFENHLTDVSRFEVIPYAILILGTICFVGLSSLFPLWQMRKLEIRELLQWE